MVRRAPVVGIFHFDGTLVEPELHAQRGEAFAEALGNFGVEEREKSVAAVHQRN